MPDVFDNDPVPADAFNPGVKFDVTTWFSKHPPTRAHVIVRAVTDALKAEGVTKFGSLGYCYGGRLCFDFAFTGEVHVVATSHPSLLQVPADLERYLATAKAPLLINSCEIDELFPVASSEAADEILGDGKFAPGYSRTYWPGCVHGFAVRGDLVREYCLSLRRINMRLTILTFNRASPRSRRARRVPSRLRSSGYRSTSNRASSCCSMPSCRLSRRTL